jgi:hypothetical protein
MEWDLAESTLLNAWAVCHVCGSRLLCGDLPIPATTDGRPMGGGTHEVLLVNNGNTAISSSALVLADSKFVQQQSNCVSEARSRGVRIIIGGHRNPTGIWQCSCID